MIVVLQAVVIVCAVLAVVLVGAIELIKYLRRLMHVDAPTQTFIKSISFDGVPEGLEKTMQRIRGSKSKKEKEKEEKS